MKLEKWNITYFNKKTKRIEMTEDDFFEDMVIAMDWLARDIAKIEKCNPNQIEILKLEKVKKFKNKNKETM